MKATLTTLSKQLGMNFHKMDPAEVQFFVTLIEKYSSAYLSMIPKKRTWKKIKTKKFLPAILMFQTKKPNISKHTYALQELILLVGAIKFQVS